MLRGKSLLFWSDHVRDAIGWDHFKALSITQIWNFIELKGVLLLDGGTLLISLLYQKMVSTVSMWGKPFFLGSDRCRSHLQQFVIINYFFLWQYKGTIEIQFFFIIETISVLMVLWGKPGKPDRVPDAIGPLVDDAKLLSGGSELLAISGY